MNLPPTEQVEAGKIAYGAIELGKELCRQDIHGLELNCQIEEYIKDMGGIPALKGYQPSFSSKPYQYAICLALDNDVVHGVPTKIICPGRLITIDLVVEYEGWFADTARTFTYGLTRKRFADISKLIFELSQDAIVPMQSIDLFGAVVQRMAQSSNFSVIKEYCGHGIGQSIHLPPQIVNYNTESSELFQVGKAYAVEPVLAINEWYTLSEADDGWTVQADCFASHNEDTVFISRQGAINLTNGQS